jgi:hypothetical protein
MEQTHSWEANISSATQKFLPTFHSTGRFLTVFTRAHRLYLYWARLIQSMSHFLSLLTLFSHLRLRLPRGLFPSDFHHTPVIYWRQQFWPAKHERLYLICGLTLLSKHTSCRKHESLWMQNLDFNKPALWPLIFKRHISGSGQKHLRIWRALYHSGQIRSCSSE